MCLVIDSNERAICSKLAQASWSSEEIDYDPDALEWDLGEEDGVEEDEDDRP